MSETGLIMPLCGIERQVRTRFTPPPLATPPTQAWGRARCYQFNNLRPLSYPLDVFRFPYPANFEYNRTVSQIPAQG